MAKNYEVGYGRPPREHQFKSGQSGNPLGARKKRPPNPLEAEAKLLFEDKRTVRENGKARKVNLVTAAMMILRAEVMKGDLRAIEYVLKRADKVAAALSQKYGERDEGAEKAELLVEAIRQTFLRPFDPGEQEEPTEGGDD
jgi:hypothetical protein